MSCKLLEIYTRVLENVAPWPLVKRFLEKAGCSGPVEVLSVGKASVSMAVAAERILEASLRRGFLLTKYGHLDSESRARLEAVFELHEAGHPVPDSAGLEATESLLRWLSRGEGELLVLMSGGASALLVAPAEPLALKDLETINHALLRSGLPIERINILRKHLSRVKGGQLARHCRYYASLKQLVLVDICAPDLDQEQILSLVGSGCFVADPFSVQDAREVLGLLDLPDEIAAKAEQALHETPKSVACKSHILASHRTLLEEARRLCPRYLSHPDWKEEITGEVREVAARFARVAFALREEGRAGILMASGEPTVVLGSKNPGRGGRCQELALRFAREIAGVRGVRLLAGSSDGTDGPTQEAGAMVDSNTWPELCNLLGETEMDRTLQEHDSGRALAHLEGALLRTGPTGQNINDLYLLEIS